ncbi:F0F1 ATP synthase subunit epsilon [Candidatus Ishikawella capsulata]|uniref:F0F1 ATP synthase subunit epsilon n=1 Tax=Candidatus Ishikawella capsulata TaxID=168169 RepID=UPI000596D689|nr:F0F1 ATP synthase subunit epsilon [Candidatus Ishikawaella capsulata]
MFVSYSLKIVNAEQSIYCEKVKSIQISGSEGNLGIFTGHSPLLTSIKPGMLRIVTTLNKEEYMYISGGILEVQPNHVIVLADTVIRGANLDEKRAIEAKIQAQAKINLSNIDINYASASVELSKAIAKLRIIELIKQQKN